MPKEFLRPAEAAAYTRVSASTLAKRRLLGEPPAFYKLAANRVVYDKADLDAWLESLRRTSTSDEGPALCPRPAAAE
jgi:predicted DNA-binding transcriptional regulator AlpA